MDEQWLAECNAAIDVQLQHPENWNKFNSGGIAVDAAPNEILENDDSFEPPAELSEPDCSPLLFGDKPSVSIAGKRPRYCWHLGCILPRVPAISSWTGEAIMAMEPQHAAPFRKMIGRECDA